MKVEQEGRYRIVKAINADER